MRWFVDVSSVGKSAEKESYCVDADSWQRALQAARTLRGEPGAMTGFSIELLDDGYSAVDPVKRQRYAIRKAGADAKLSEGAAAMAAPSQPPPSARPASSPPPSASPSKPPSARPSRPPAPDLNLSPKGKSKGKTTPPPPVVQTPAVVAGSTATSNGAAKETKPGPSSSRAPGTLEVLAQREQDPDAESPLVYREYAYLVEGTPDPTEAERLLRQELSSVQRVLGTSRTGKLVNLALFNERFSGRPTTRPLAALTWKDWRGDAVVTFPARTAKAPVPAPAPVEDKAPAQGVTPTATAPEAAAPVPAPAAVASTAPPTAIVPTPVVIVPEPAPKPASLPPVATPTAPEPPAAPSAPPPSATAAAPSAPPPASLPLAPSVPPPSAPPPTSIPPSSALPAFDPFPSVPPPAKPISIPPDSAAPPTTRGSDFPGLTERPAAGPKTRLRGDELIADLFDAMHDLQFLRDAVEGADFCLTLALEKMPAAGGIVHLYDIDHREFVITCAGGPGGEGLLLQRSAETEPLLSRAMRQRRAVVLADAQASVEAKTAARYVALGGARSAMIAPVALGGRFLGAIELLNPIDDSPFTPDDGYALTYIAEQLASFVATRGITLERPDPPTAGDPPRPSTPKTRR